MFSQFIRFSTVLISILFYLAHMGLVWSVIWDRWRRVEYSNKILMSYCKWGLWLLRVKVNPVDIERHQGVSGLMVGNHLSYLDVLVITSLKPACFVTSTEIRDTPGLGLICKMAGCLFVERRNKNNIHNEVNEITQGLRHGLNVTIFPESTSTNGEQILRFRRPLYVAAVDASQPVLPFCLNYRYVGGEPITVKNRDQVFWYGDMEFLPHLWALAGAGSVGVDLNFLPAIPTDEKSDPTQLAEASQAQVESVFRRVVPN